MVTEITVIPHLLKFKFLAKTSRDELRTKETNFIILTDENGKKGIGEASIIPGLSIENPADFNAQLRSLTLDSLTDYHDTFKAYPAIRFGLETALLDLETGCRRELFPTDFTLKNQPIPINGLVWMGNADFMRTQLKEKLAAGFTCIKLKIGALDFQQELDILKLIRKDFSASDIEIRVDANGAFSPETALEKIQILSEFQLHSIEQPIRQGQLEEMANLCEKTPLPIALDEELIGINTLEQKTHLLNLIQPQYIILKPSLLGGFSASEEWISEAQKLGIPYWNTSALEANIGLNAISQWTSSLNNPLPQGLGTGGLYHNNVPCPLNVRNGMISYDQSKNWDLTLLDI